MGWLPLRWWPLIWMLTCGNLVGRWLLPLGYLLRLRCLLPRWRLLPRWWRRLWVLLELRGLWVLLGLGVVLPLGWLSGACRELG